jgi:hypothetical protein
VLVAKTNASERVLAHPALYVVRASLSAGNSSTCLTPASVLDSPT